MSAIRKIAWKKWKYRFNSQIKQTTTHSDSMCNFLEICEVHNPKCHSLFEVKRQEHNLHVTTSVSSYEPHCPIFTIIIGLLDVFILILLYYVEDGPVITPETWVKMGCKYVPCMKSLSSSIEQELYSVELKSKCRSFLYPHQFFRFVTPIFLHGDINHLLSNLAYQALTGTLLEGKYGKKTLIICYILFGCSANIMSSICNPKTISVGASGAVYGLLFFCTIDNILRIFTITNIQDKIIQFLITLLVIPYFILSILLDIDSLGHADHAAHIGGAIMGVFVALLLCDMPQYVLIRISAGEKRIKSTALILILAYFLSTLLIFYLFTPVYLK